MNLTLDQALQKGVEAHKAGKVQEADRYYTAIIKANPKHTDANHNMGVLAVGVGKVEAALPFFKTALEANPKIEQFWLSYMDALIKLDRMADAKAVFDQAKNAGMKGGDFDQIEERLFRSNRINNYQTGEDILGKAVELRENGKYNEAIDLLLHQINQFPKDPDVPAILSHCYILNNDLEQAEIYLDVAKNINPNIASVGWNESRLLLKHKKVDEALVVAQRTNKLFPDDIEGIAVLGSCLRSSDNFDESQKYLNKAIELNPHYAEALINRGLIYLNKKDKSNALTDLEKAHVIKPHIKQIWHLVLHLKMEFKDFEHTIYIAEEMIKIDPVDEKIIASMALCHQHLKNYHKAEIFYKKALRIKPDYFEALSNMGIVLKAQDRLEEAIKAYNKALSINADNSEIYNNKGVTLQDQGKLEEAIKAFNKALSIKPDYAEAYNNKGVTLQDQGKLEEAIETYHKALSIKPDYAEAYNNMGNAFKDQGKLEEAIETYHKALSIKPDYAEAIENSQSLAVQLLPIITNYGYDFDNYETEINSKLVLWPKYQIQNAIKAYLEANFSQANLQNNNFRACDQKLFGKLAPKDKVFCTAYSTFIGKLLYANRDNAPALTTENKVYHLGESHCLSYAHRNVAIGDSCFRIVPRMTFGAKAFHFSRSKHNSFKAITNAHFASLPQHSKVFISFGEIDCRPTEGFMSAAKKYQKPIEDLVSDTLRGYVDWFAEQNESKNHSLFFFNVPAPVYNKEYGSEVNGEVTRTIKLFNSLLYKTVLDHDFKIIDVYKFTVGHDGFSNSLFHIDSHHLSNDAISEIEKQIGTFL